MKFILIPALALGLAGCEATRDFFRSVNTPENREVGVQAAMAAIKKFNADGFDPLQLKDWEKDMAIAACIVVAGYLANRVEDEAEREEVLAFGQDVCNVLGIALAPAAPVEAPEPEPVEVEA